MKDPKQILVEARALIEDPDNWTRGVYARDETGRSLSSGFAPGACVWCAAGAVEAAAGEDDYRKVDSPFVVAYRSLSDAARQIPDGPPALSIEDLNDQGAIPDDYEDAHSNVLKAFDIAIERLS